ncbi:hypothetical protein OAK16_04735 [Verrucomicrobia bacterium]|nr:hypothetical protein [Verrucomicrobiota bacterium]
MATKANDKKLQRWKLYALGGGLGHLQRSLALARAAIRKGHYVDIICNSRFSKFIPWEGELGDSGSLTIIDNKSSIKKTFESIIKWITNDDFDQLIIDTLPRGIVGELKDIIKSIKKPKTFIHRDLNPDYVKQFNLKEFIKQYDLIIVPGEKNPIKDINQLSFCHSTDPWLIRNYSEIKNKNLARVKLEMDPNDIRPLAIISMTGNLDEERLFLKLKTELQNSISGWVIKTVSPIPEIADLRIWPLLEIINGVDMIIGAGGYNTVNEVRVTRTPFIGHPLSRMYDRQEKRLKDDEIYKQINEISKFLQKNSIRTDCNPFINGTFKAVELIETL